MLFGDYLPGIPQMPAGMGSPLPVVPSFGQFMGGPSPGLPPTPMDIPTVQGNPGLPVVPENGSVVPVWRQRAREGLLSPQQRQTLMRLPDQSAGTYSYMPLEQHMESWPPPEGMLAGAEPPLPTGMRSALLSQGYPNVAMPPQVPRPVMSPQAQAMQQMLGEGPRVDRLSRLMGAQLKANYGVRLPGGEPAIPMGGSAPSGGGQRSLFPGTSRLEAAQMKANGLRLPGGEPAIPMGAPVGGPGAMLPSGEASLGPMRGNLYMGPNGVPLSEAPNMIPEGVPGGGIARALGPIGTAAMLAGAAAHEQHAKGLEGERRMTNHLNPTGAYTPDVQQGVRILQQTGDVKPLLDVIGQRLHGANQSANRFAHGVGPTGPVPAMQGTGHQAYDLLSNELQQAGIKDQTDIARLYRLATARRTQSGNTAEMQGWLHNHNTPAVTPSDQAFGAVSGLGSLITAIPYTGAALTNPGGTLQSALNGMGINVDVNAPKTPPMVSSALSRLGDWIQSGADALGHEAGSWVQSNLKNNMTPQERADMMYVMGQ